MAGPLTPREKKLFTRWSDDTLSSRVRAVAGDTLGIYSAHVTQDGDVHMPLPTGMRREGGPRSVLMVGGAAFREEGFGAAHYLKNFTVGGEQQRQALVMWLDNEALGRRRDEPVTKESHQKLRERVDEMRAALCQKFDLTHEQLRASLCIPNEEFSAATGHKSCAAIVLAAEPDVAPLLQNEIHDCLQQARAAAPLDRIAPKGTFTQRFPLPPRPFGPLEMEDRKHHLDPPKPSSQRKILSLPAPASEPAQANPFVGKEPELGQFMQEVLGPIEVHAIDADGIVKCHVPTLNGDHMTPNIVAVNTRSSDAQAQTTHFLTFWIGSEDLRMAIDDMRSLTGDEAHQAKEHVRMRFAPLNQYIERMYSCDSGFTPQMLDLSKPLLVMIEVNSGAEQKDMLNDLKSRLETVRQQGREQGGSGQYRGH